MSMATSTLVLFSDVGACWLEREERETSYPHSLSLSHFPSLSLSLSLSLPILIHTRTQPPESELVYYSPAMLMFAMSTSDSLNKSLHRQNVFIFVCKCCIHMQIYMYTLRQCQLCIYMYIHACTLYVHCVYINFIYAHVYVGN